ncbi:hypothetical protein HPP92_019234 [Vanilla planifolia]|uniref:RCC1-like domain-containing protein n=1 Tax=Vanilla planifolia TaxID=51239 RepID=A0A835QDM4_VANPL|nr:hypothetical protein HPP92_019234 [Vanilla planifolia]
MRGGEGNGIAVAEEMEETGRVAGKAMEEGKGASKVILMWGYLPGASPQRAPLLHPVVVDWPEFAAGDAWRDVAGGGCGFAMAISESGKLMTWGSSDDMGQSYLTSGKHMDTPEAFPLPTDVEIVKAAAGWAHCVAVAASGEVYTWGWKECVPTGKVIGEHHLPDASMEKDERPSGFPNEQVSPRSHGSRTNSGTISNAESRNSEEITKRRRISSSKQDHESSSSGEETLSALPCLVILGAGVRITAVAAGGRHTLALSDLGQVWGWGYGGEGQLGLGSRIRMVSSPHPVPCIESASYVKDRATGSSKANTTEGHAYRIIGTYVKAIACGGRHSAVVTDSGAVLTFGWGLYGQCGHGITDDELSPKCVSSLLGLKMQGVAAGLWHTLCVSDDGDVYAFGGNQFGQLGTGLDQAETLPKLLDAPSLESSNAKIVSCGARHSASVTDDSKVFCWGWNKYGQLGLGDSIDRSIPSQVPIENLSVMNVTCGWWHTLLLAESPT